MVEQCTESRNQDGLRDVQIASHVGTELPCGPYSSPCGTYSFGSARALESAIASGVLELPQIKQDHRERQLLGGCGNSRKKKIAVTGFPTEWTNLITLDHDPECEPDVLYDLDQLPYPFPDNCFDELAFYEVLEHCGRQGDWKFFFDQFSEFHRILKPGGVLVATVPMWDTQWAWADPGHTRVITRNSLIFLDQREYGQVGETDITDYRRWYKANFELIGQNEQEHKFIFVLRAIKGDVKNVTQMLDA